MQNLQVMDHEEQFLKFAFCGKKTLITHHENTSLRPLLNTIARGRALCLNHILILLTMEMIIAVI